MLPCLGTKFYYALLASEISSPEGLRKLPVLTVGIVSIMTLFCYTKDERFFGMSRGFLSLYVVTVTNSEDILPSSESGQDLTVSSQKKS